jgi:3-phenylpropionate/trans-cinnamate dioxygenase ferredoxin subunit
VTYNYSTLDKAQLAFFEIAPASELPPGERLFVDLEGQMIVIFNIAGAYFAIADVCSHDDGPVGEGDLAGYEVTCPRHGAGFDVRTGKVTKMPAVVDIPAYPVEIREGTIFVGLPKA